MRFVARLHLHHLERRRASERTAVSRPQLGRLVCMLTMTCVVGLSSTACGQSDTRRADIAVEVGPMKITKPEVRHWMAVIAGEISTKAGEPAVQVPKPPLYTECIAYRRSLLAASGDRSAPAPAALERECELELEKEKLKALYSLIATDWAIGTAAELDVPLSHRELLRELSALERQAPNPTLFRTVVVGRNGTAKDLQHRVELELLTKRIQKKIERSNDKLRLSTGQREHVFAAFNAQQLKRWTARTDCNPGYVVPICRQYNPHAQKSSLTPPSIPLVHLIPE